MELNNLDKLADQIYLEGIEKAQKESDKLVFDAKSKAEEIINKARAEAEGIRKNAEKDAEKERLSARNEIELAGKQALSKLKADIKNILSDKIASQPVSDSFDDEEFIKKLIFKIVSQWSPEQDITVIIPEETESDIQSFLETKAVKSLPGLTIKTNPEINKGFVIENNDKGYYVSFTEEDLHSFIKDYISSKLEKLIFE